MSSIETALMQKPTPCYIYDKANITAQIEGLKEVFPTAGLLFSIKSNPMPEVVRHIAENGVGSDAAALNEVTLSEKSGMAMEDIYYSAAGKTRADLEAAWGRCTLIADSYHELEMLNEIAANKGVSAKVGVRVNPDFAMFGGAGTASKFGVDEEDMLKNKAFFDALGNLKITGIHVHVRSQVLDAQALVQYYQNVYGLAKKLHDELGFPIEFINFGGGVGIVYSKIAESPLDRNVVKEGFAKLDAQNSAELGARLLIETGRFLVCGAGSYVTEIVDIKVSRGKKYLIVKNGLNGFMRPVIKELLKGFLKDDSFAAEPLFTRRDAFEYSILTDESETETVNVVGHLCTAADVLASDVTLPKAKIGDRVVISNAGSYAYTLSPVLFSSQELPGQYLV